MRIPILQAARLRALLTTVALAATLIVMPGFAFPDRAGADPSGPPTYRALAGGGSATTAELMQSMSNAVTVGGTPVLGSYHAAGSPTIRTKDTAACELNRPANEAAGVAALNASTAAANGCLQFTRLSAEPSIGGTAQSDTAYLPYARDSLSFVVSRATTLGRQLSMDRLRAIYTCQEPAAHPLLPARGSQLRAQWLALLTISESQLEHDYTCVRDQAAGTGIRDNDAGVLDNAAVLPFSVAQYIAQSVSKGTDTRAGTHLGTITGPTGGDGRAPIEPNPTYNDVAVALVPGDLPSSFTIVQFQRIYRCLTSVIAGVPVTPALPPTNTPARQAWLTLMHIGEDDLINGDYPCVRTLPAAANDTRALPPNTLMPFAISAYVRQTTGAAVDQRGSAVLVPIEWGGRPGQTPYAINVKYGAALVHPVYNAVPRATLAASPAREVFAGPASLICQQVPLILAYGFAEMPEGTCGGGPGIGQSTYMRKTFAGVGSATTAGVTMALAEHVTTAGHASMASFDSIGSPTIATTSDSCRIPRPANDAQAIAQVVASVGDRCVQFAGVSGRDPGATPGTTPLAYAPFALDATTYAVTAGSTVPRSRTKAQLQSIYRCQTAGVLPTLPAQGSELRARWLRYLGITESQLAGYGCVKSVDGGGSPIVENDGQSLPDNAVVPYSTASYLAQAATMQPDRRGRAVLGTVTDPAGPAPVRANLDAYPDDVTFAVRGDVAMPRRLSSAQLHAIYTCVDRRYVPALPPAGPVRAAFARLVGITEAEFDTYPCVVRTDPTGAVIPANDGRTLPATTIVPYSISTYAAQLLGSAADLRGNAVLGVLDQGGGNPALPMRLDTGYVPALVHRVYHVFPEAAANTSPINELFVGPNARICRLGTVIAGHGFAQLPATDPEPCGVLQRPTAARASAASMTMRGAMPLDDGQIAGSGAKGVARHGACTLHGGFNNAWDGTNTALHAEVWGGSCRASLEARWFDHETGEEFGPDVKTATTSGYGKLEFAHTPGTLVQQLHGRSQITGHQLTEVRYTLTDLSAGAPSGSSSVVVVGTPVPSVFGLTVNSTAINGQSAMVNWWRNENSPSPAYRVYRDLVGGPSDFQLIATVNDIPGAFALTYHDTSVQKLRSYAYRVSQYWPATNFEGLPSVELAVTPAATASVKHYVALGDSYSSGEGAGNYLGGIGTRCHRSESGYAMLLTNPNDQRSLATAARNGDARLDLIACSGGTARNVIPGLPPVPPIRDGSNNVVMAGVDGSKPQSGMEPVESLVPWDTQRYLMPDYQVEMLARTADRMPVDLVTISIGGNDVGFAKVLEHCVLFNCTPYEGALQARVDALRPDLEKTYTRILEVSGRAQLKVIGYPKLFPDQGTSNCALRSLPPNPWMLLDSAEMRMLNRLTDRLNGVIEQAADTVNHGYGRTSYFDVRPLFAGHDICAGSPWLRPLIPDAVTSEGAHPNGAGWQAEAGFIAGEMWGL